MKNYINVLLFVGLTIIVSACSASMDKPRSADPVFESQKISERVPDAGQYILGPGDILRIIVFGDEQLSGEFVVDVSGQISMPLIQQVDASGHSAKELEEIITGKLHPQYLTDPKVSVQVVEYRGVYILGEVRLPGKYPYVPNMTLLQAIAVAGGHTYRADEHGAEISRQVEGQVQKFKLKPEGYIMPGDTIVVGRRWF